MKSQIKAIGLFISILFGTISNTLGQQNKTWYLGNNAGISFNQNIPVALTNGALTTYDNAAAISNEEGGLLFYTNGQTVWDQQHNIMVNGTGLLGSSNGGQVALIVPQPNSFFYYIFTVNQFAGANGFRYHIVDMTLNSGLGEVISKNNLLFSPSTERIDAIYNYLTNSYWVITHKWNSNEFCAYNVISAGLLATPVISTVGSIHQGGATGVYNSMGQLTISPDGTKIACGIYSEGKIELFDFNMATGILSNPIVVTGYPNIWGVAFSPDSKKLYVTKWFGTTITQLDVTNWNLASITASAVVVGNVTGPGNFGYHVGYLELGPDDKIYAAVYDDTYLGVINNPNATGMACNVIDNGFYLGGKTSSAGLCRSVNKLGFTNTSLNGPADKPILFPNPSTGDLNLYLGDQFNNETIIINITDLKGNLIYSQSSILNSEIKLQLKHLASGMYWIEIQSRKDFRKIHAGKFVVIQEN